MADQDITLSALENFLRVKQKTLAFPKWLEERYERDRRVRRSQHLRAGLGPIFVVYNVFLIADWLLIPDRLALAAALHAFVVTPWILLTRWLVGPNRPRLLREGAAASIPIAIVLQILCTFTLTTSPDAGHYQYFVLLVLLFTNTVLRPPFSYAAILSVLIIVLQAIAVTAHPHMSGPAASVALVTLSAAAYLTLVSNFHLERDARRAYLRSLRDRLRHAEADAAAKRDALTDLGNRHLLASRVETLWGDGRTADAKIAAILLDIDHFKLFNDRYGHSAGDLCLKRVAACVASEIRDGDTAIRYGGEEILALLPGADLPEAARIAERVRRAVEDLGLPNEGIGARSVVTASLGVAAGPVATISAAELISAADAALYAAKRNGRNQIWPAQARAVVNAASVIVRFAGR